MFAFFSLTVAFMLFNSQWYTGIQQWYVSNVFLGESFRSCSFAWMHLYSIELCMFACSFCSRKMSILVEYLFQCMIKVVVKCQLAPNKLIKTLRIRIIVETVVFHWHFSSHNRLVRTTIIYTYCINIFNFEAKHRSLDTFFSLSLSPCFDQ